MLAGLEEPDAGQIIKPSGLTVGYLPQDGLTHSGWTLLEEAGLAFKTLLDMRTEIAALEERLAEDHPDDSGTRSDADEGTANFRRGSAARRATASI